MLQRQHTAAGRLAPPAQTEVVALQHTSSILVTPEQGGAEAVRTGQAAPQAPAAPRLVKARTLLSAEDVAHIEARGRSSSGSGGASPLCVFSAGAEKYVSSLDGLVPSNAVAERLADGQVHALAKVVGG